MKKKSLTLLCALVLTTTAPIATFAESIDSKIDASKNRIEVLKQEQADASAALAQIETEINNLATKVQDTLTKKNELEMKLNDLNLEITKLEDLIQKRSTQINQQARATQIEQSSNTYIEALLNSESISDAITRTVAYTRLASANNDIITTQKNDQDRLVEAKADLDESIVEVEGLTKELKTQQDTMVGKRESQAVLAAQVAANLTDEEVNKDSLVTEKAAEEARIAAEAKKAEEARLAQAAKEKAEQEKLNQLAVAKDNEIANEINNINTQVMPDDKPTPPANNGGGGSNNNVNTQPTNPGGFQMPTSGFTVTSGFGPRIDPMTGSSNGYHDGIDLAAPTGTPIYASRGGEVVTASYHYSGGNMVIIKHDNGYYTYYMHMNSTPSVSVGQQVSAGTYLGPMGSTGDSTGSHLHFGIATGIWSGFVNPAPFIGL